MRAAGAGRQPVPWLWAPAGQPGAPRLRAQRRPRSETRGRISGRGRRHLSAAASTCRSATRRRRARMPAAASTCRSATCRRRARMPAASSETTRPERQPVRCIAGSAGPPASARWSGCSSGSVGRSETPPRSPFPRSARTWSARAWALRRATHHGDWRGPAAGPTADSDSFDHGSSAGSVPSRPIQAFHARTTNPASS